MYLPAAAAAPSRSARGWHRACDAARSPRASRPHARRSQSHGRPRQRSSCPGFIPLAGDERGISAPERHEIEPAADPQARQPPADRAAPACPPRVPHRTGCGRWRCRRPPASTLRARCSRRCEYSSSRSSSAASSRTFESLPMPKRPSLARRRRPERSRPPGSPRSSDTVRRPPAGARSPAARLPCMGGMHQAPALIDLVVLEQPLERPLPAPGQAVLDLPAAARRCGCARPRPARVRSTARELLRRHGPQAVRGHPTAAPGSVRTAARLASRMRAKRCRVGDEAPLSRRRGPHRRSRCARKTPAAG